MMSKTVFVTQEGPANALALNKDNSQVVIAGRNGMIFYFKNLIKNHYLLKFEFLQYSRYLHYWRTDLRRCTIFELEKT